MRKKVASLLAQSTMAESEIANELNVDSNPNLQVECNAYSLLFILNERNQVSNIQ